MKKQNAIIRIVIFSIVIILLLGLLAAGLGGKYYLARFTASSSSANIASRGEVDASKVRNLDIQWVSGSVTVQPGDTDAIIFSEDEDLPEDEKLIWKLSGDTLVIQFCKTQVLVGFQSTHSKDLVITVPKDWECGTLELELVSADAEITDLTAKTIDLENVSGECLFQNCSTDSFDAETVSGNVDFAGSLRLLSFDTVSADCTATVFNTPTEVDLDSVSGNLDITLPETCGFVAELDSASGNIRSDFSASVSGGRYVYGDGSCQIEGNSLSGDIMIRKGN